MTLPTSPSAPLHIYILLDSSASMYGAAQVSMLQGLQLLCATFISRSKRTVQVALASYDSTVHEITPLSDVNGFEPPQLDIGGSSGLGAALRYVAATMLDHHPTLVYVFTDGEPTDDWEAAVAAIRPRIEKLYALLCGPSAQPGTIAPKFDQVFTVQDFAAELLFETFRMYN